MSWIRQGVNYWENPDCPNSYLEGALVRLINDIEGVKLPINYFEGIDREYLIERIGFYESVSDK